MDKVKNMNKQRKLFIILFSVKIVVLFTVLQAWATTVDVYAEGGYTDTEFTINIYANIDPTAQGPLLSAGVKLLFPSSKIQNPVASPNEKEWYLGTPENKYPYIGSNVDSVGEVRFLLGKLDQNNPQEGVEGDRIHLGRIKFDRISGSAIPGQADFLLLSGNVAPFVDFATVTGVELDDSVSFSISPVVSTAILNLRGVIRILRVVSEMAPDVPVRATEMDTDDDGVVGIREAIMLLKEAAQ